MICLQLIANGRSSNFYSVTNIARLLLIHFRTDSICSLCDEREVKKEEENLICIKLRIHGLLCFNKMNVHSKYKNSFINASIVSIMKGKLKIDKLFVLPDI